MKKQYENSINVFILNAIHLLSIRIYFVDKFGSISNRCTDVEYILKNSIGYFNAKHLEKLFRVKTEYLYSVINNELIKELYNSCT